MLGIPTVDGRWGYMRECGPAIQIRSRRNDQQAPAQAHAQVVLPEAKPTLKRGLDRGGAWEGVYN